MSSFCTVELTILDVNNNPPIFTLPVYWAEVTENSEPTTIVQVKFFSLFGFSVVVIGTLQHNAFVCGIEMLGLVAGCGHRRRHSW